MLLSMVKDDVILMKWHKKYISIVTAYLYQDVILYTNKSNSSRNRHPS